MRPCGDWLSGTILWYMPDAGFSGYDLFEYEAFDPYSAYPRQAVDTRAAVAIRVGEADAPLGKPNDKGGGVRYRGWRRRGGAAFWRAPVSTGS